MRILAAVLVLLGLAGCASEGCQNGERILTDLVVGEGTEATAGDKVQLHFTLQDPQGIIIENTYGTQPVELYLDAPDAEFVFGLPGRAIYESLLGMKAGGQRSLLVPPQEAYGSAYPSQCQHIRYTLDLLSVVPD